MDAPMHAQNGEREGRAHGGKARAKALTKSQRSSIAKKAAKARWNPAIPDATFGSPETPLVLGGTPLDCYVLDTQVRVFSQRGMIASLGLKPRGGEFLRFVEQAKLRGKLTPEAIHSLENPIQFHPPGGGRTAFGYPATLLIDLCNAILEDRGSVPPHYQSIAARAEIIVRSVAKVGIIALIDEVTGYQEIRDREALQALLDLYLRREFAAWAKRFPDDFYREMFRLRKWEWKRPGHSGHAVAHYTNDLVYERLAPKVLEELQRRNPRINNRRKGKHHQLLTTDVGLPKLAEHLSAVVALMKASDNWESFYRGIERALPIRQTLQLPLPLDGPSDRAATTESELPS